MLKKNLIIIPVRMASTRLPNKPMADIAGQTMIARVYKQALKANVGEVLIACDCNEIADEAQRINANFIITDPNLPSGTDRIFSALEQYQSSTQREFSTITNLQGDLPDIDPEVIVNAVELAQNSDFDITTVATVIKEPSQINNPNIVKIALSKDSRALYFSRSPIPYSKDNDGEYLHHIGIYVYKISALKKFVKLPVSPLEKRESLEQLRALENNLSIGVRIVDNHPLSVDTAEDLAMVNRIIKQRQSY
ncbi:MAG: 3-deoxy-manno-octulosonate cytidylyltransferase [Alphaproteobacteria bacterium]